MEKWQSVPPCSKNNRYYGVFGAKGEDSELIALCPDEANARLIAAVPELYEAVCDLLDYAYEALHYAGGENETRGKAPGILRDIQEYQELLARINKGAG